MKNLSPGARNGNPHSRDFFGNDVLRNRKRLIFELLPKFALTFLLIAIQKHGRPSHFFKRSGKKINGVLTGKIMFV
ncbi:MAG: hypothetical protein MSS85_11285, partial [Pyramidobacter sp.]|uniref:hypothetical protein n=1 Tax=Pyramidobacter sp. TaxID=1943581 RepID=UPI0025E11984